MSGTPQNQPLEPLPFRPRPPVVIGILGGIAAGKSAVATAFAAHGVRHIDADGIARQVSARPEVVQAVARDLGPDVVGADGRLDRQRLAVMIFSDPAARARLEALTHPPVRAAILLDLAKARSEATSVLLDVPLLLERGLIGECDYVVFVAASEATRSARAAERGWEPAELARREAAQAPLSEKRARANFLLDNDGSLDDLRRQVAGLLTRLTEATR